VKIKLVHDVCGRDVLVRQVLDSEGHCPWDGKPFTRDYTASLAEALEAAEIAGTALEAALQQVAGYEPAFVFDKETVIDPLQEQLDRLGATKRAAR